MSKVRRVTHQLEVFALRALKLADRVAIGELPFFETVNTLYEATVDAGVVDALVHVDRRSSNSQSPPPLPMRGGRHDRPATIPARRD